jgi:hypothetical protein
MKWDEVRGMLRKKLDAEHAPGKKHDFWHVHCDGVYVGRVKDVHGRGEVTNPERGGIADSLKLNEYDLRALVSCTLSREEFCAKVNPPAAP